MAADTSRPKGSPAEEDELSRLVRTGVKSAVARWVLQRRRRGGEPGPSTRDEGTHRWDGRKRFAEDYTFAGVQSGLGMLIRTEWLPNRAAHRVWVLLLTPEGSWALPEMLGGGPSLVRGQHEPWKVGGVEIDCVQPHVRWTVRFAGELASAEDELTPRASIDLTFVRTADPFMPGTHDDPELIARNLGDADWDRRLLRTLRRGSSRGYVQLGELHGTVALGARMIPVRAVALREHTWGVRDWGASDRALQVLLALGDGRRAWAHRAEFPWMTLEGGFVLERDAAPGALPIRAIGVTREAQPDGAPLRMGFNLDYGAPGGLGPVSSLAAPTRLLRSVGFPVDGRGELDLGLLAMEDGGTGLWARQRRTLPRPGIDR